ncbi:hypothetical protein IEQ34_000741 [Dendrobium chrysotoxum]|uniref:U-box domain-containing protein n=1 Tax=Dendrobium chrysotoxum TaxID=161865 RepID=A0AAV7HU13_DENCH|nr:hypothetical protein IEQ34_000741 [Dendrobium chrysotoxum]
MSFTSSVFRKMWSVALPLSVTIPKDFYSPISLDLMRDLVITSFGQTYDRASITQWIEEGHCTCPNSGQMLSHTRFLPKRELFDRRRSGTMAAGRLAGFFKSLDRIIYPGNRSSRAINTLVSEHTAKWMQDSSRKSPMQLINEVEGRIVTCEGDSNPALGHPIEFICLDLKDPAICKMAACRAAFFANKKTAEILLGKLALGSESEKAVASLEISLLAKTGKENRACIAELGAIPLLEKLLNSSNCRTQETQ